MHSTARKDGTGIDKTETFSCELSEGDASLGCRASPPPGKMKVTKVDDDGCRQCPKYLYQDFLGLVPIGAVMKPMKLMMKAPMGPGLRKSWSMQKGMLQNAEINLKDHHVLRVFMFVQSFQFSFF